MSSRARWVAISVLAAAVAGTVWLVLPARPTSAEERIRTTLQEAAQAAEKRKVDDVVEILSERFTGKGEGERASRDEVRRMLAFELLRGAWVSVTISSAEVIVDGSRARANVDALLSRAEDRTKGLASLLPGRPRCTASASTWRRRPGSGAWCPGPGGRSGSRRPSPGRALRIGEDASPRYVDRARRGRTPRRAHAMAVYTVLDAEQLAAALKQFGLAPPSQARAEPRGAVNTGYHLWSGGHRFFLRVNEGKSEQEVRFEAEAQQYLHAARFPVPELRLALDGRPSMEVSGKPAMLLAYAPGEELAPAALGPERCRRVGEQLGRLHELAAGFAASRPNPYGRTWVAERVRELASAGDADPERAAVLPLLQDELAVSARLPGAPRGLVHGDLFVDNVLWIGDRVSALLDWEMSCIDAFAYDLGVALHAWCYADGYQADRGRALLAGYRSRRRDRAGDGGGAVPVGALRGAAVRGGPPGRLRPGRRPGRAARREGLARVPGSPHGAPQHHRPGVPRAARPIARS